MQIPSHLRPRSARGWFIIAYFVALFALTQWPFLAWANRIEPLVFGLPFLYAYLSIDYALMLVGLWLLWRWRL